MIDDIKTTFTDLSGDVKEIILERLKNPFLNFYIFFLIFYNWDILLYLFFSKENIEIQIQCVKQMYHEFDIYWILNWRFIAPLIYSFVSNIIYLLISICYDFINSPLIYVRYKKYCKEEIKKIKEYKNVLVERTGNKELEDYEKEVTRLTQEIEILKDRNLDLLNDVKEFQKNNKLNLNKVQDTITSPNLSSNIDDKNKKIIQGMIFDNIGLPRLNNNGEFVIIDYVLKELFNKQPFNHIDLQEILFDGLKLLYFETEYSEKLHNSRNLKSLLLKNAGNIIYYLENKFFIKIDPILSNAKGSNYYEIVD